MKTKKLVKMEENKFTEFPELQFYQSEAGIIYFDVTFCLELKQHGKRHNAENFLNDFSIWVQAVQTVYNISNDDLMVLNETNEHYMIEETLALLFIGYTDPSYLLYTIERINEMHVSGLVLSDTTLMLMLRNRFAKEDIIKICD